MCVSAARPSIRAFPTERKSAEGKARRKKARRVTVASIQEGEKEKKSQPRNKVPIKFPQQFSLVNRVPTLFCHLNRTRLVEIDLFSVFGHSWREERERKGCVS